MSDKVLHSAVGLGAYMTAFLSIMLGASIWVLTAPLLLALGKEAFDMLRGRVFDWGEVLATLNPFIVISWYFRITK